MTIGVVGKKCGMTRVYAEDGSAVPVTVIEVEPNRITQRKTADNDGYEAIQVTVGTRRPVRVSKAAAGHFGKAGVGAGRGLWEFRLSEGEGKELQVGAEVKVDIFKVGQKVDVRGTSIGKGFQGTVKRHHFATQDATHGNSLSHRAPGSIGQRQTPGRVFKGKRMSGHMGNIAVTMPNLVVVRVDADRNLLLVKGAVPGSKGGDVLVIPTTRGRS